MTNINFCVVAGRLSRDPELRATSGGTPVLNFGIAVNESRKNSQGQWEDYANFFDCTMFGKRAESLSKMLSKGAKVTVSGRLHWSRWERDGQRRSKVEIMVDDVELMTQARDQQQTYGQPTYNQPTYTQDQLEDPRTWQQPAYDDREDLPF